MGHNRRQRSTEHILAGGVSMSMNEVIINALFARIKAGQMTIEQAPIPYQGELQARLEQESEE